MRRFWYTLGVFVMKRIKRRFKSSVVHLDLLCLRSLDFFSVSNIILAGTDLGRECRGCTPSTPPDIVFAFKICLPRNSVTPYVSGTSLPKKKPGSASFPDSDVMNTVSLSDYIDK